MDSVKITDSKEAKQAWLNHVIESDPWMAKYIELPYIIKEGKERDPEMAELAQQALDKLNQED